jgi:hypothetical protein
MAHSTSPHGPLIGEAYTERVASGPYGQQRQTKPSAGMSGCPQKAAVSQWVAHWRSGPMHSDVPSQALSARLIALWLPCWLEGVGSESCRGEGGT